MNNTRTAKEAHAWRVAGWRERYAMQNGKKEKTLVNGRPCWRYVLAETDDHQNANGATFDTVRGVWID